MNFFRNFWHTKPRQCHVIQICQDEICQATMSARELTEHAKIHLGLDFHETDDAGRITLEPVNCLGNCARSPTIMIDNKMHGRVTAERFDELVESLVEDN